MLKKKYMLLLVAVSVISLACLIPGMAKPTPTQPPATATPAEVTGDIHFSFTEDQINELIKQQLSSIKDFPIETPHASLPDGEVLLVGKVKLNVASTEAEVVLVPDVENGKLVWTAKSAKLGPVPMPDTALQQLTSLVNQLTEYLLKEEDATFIVERVSISNRTLTIDGKSE